jgi:hypothetical protein
VTPGQGGAEEGGGGGIGAGDLLGRAFGDDAAAGGAGLGADLQNPVGGFEHVEVVLDDDDAVAAVDKLLQHGEEPLHVVAMQAGRRFVQQQQRARGRRGFWVLSFGFCAGCC